MVIPIQEPDIVPQLGVKYGMVYLDKAGLGRMARQAVASFTLAEVAGILRIPLAYVEAAISGVNPKIAVWIIEEFGRRKVRGPYYLVE